MDKRFCSRGLSRFIPASEWRRERDSNPRYGFPYSGFQDHPFQPLTHPSAAVLNAFYQAPHTAEEFTRETSQGKSAKVVRQLSNPARSNSSNSSRVSLSADAATLSSRCFTEDVPGIGSMIGERCNNHASAT